MSLFGGERAGERTCHCCGKVFLVMCPDDWVYKARKNINGHYLWVYFCRYDHWRKETRGKKYKCLVKNS